MGSAIVFVVDIEKPPLECEVASFDKCSYFITLALILCHKEKMYDVGAGRLSMNSQKHPLHVYKCSLNVKA